MRQNYQISEQFPSREEEEALDFPVFARKDYWLLHLKERKLFPITVRDRNDNIMLFWCFYITESGLITPFNAPFFTPYLDANITDHLLFREVIDYCKIKYGSSLQFKLKSDSLLQKLKTSCPSLKIAKVEIGASLTVSEESFSQKIIKKRKRRKLKSLLSDDGFKISEVLFEGWATTYEQNLIWRKQKGHKNFISTSEIVKARDKFPFSYNALSLRKGNELVGTAFFLIMDTKQIYVYSLITDPLIDFQEPSLLLWKALYEWAQRHNISTIDMGTSILADGRINKSLMRYKLFIGGSLYKKYTLEC